MTSWLNRQLRLTGTGRRARRPAIRPRQIVDQRIEQWLNTAVSRGGTTQYRDDLSVFHALFEPRDELISGDGIVFEVAHHELFVLLSNRLDELLTELATVVLEFRWDWHRFEPAVMVIVKHVRAFG